ncbi:MULTISPECIES: TldD/PmbA family protein [Clostridium]|uniref:Predicted Zn-dependent proteases, TLDD ortholog n=1 Tax=Clostridium acetobutylicum (strain ATCC 824 / DSM 792 / JCM 1419 / IAM 19013 / LMG 5710 / NBRC 13948 / NRRL B-527 / VKM B-1787 / 2291 / W) TaxID=272562 RepID=Q97MG9_CLOAB|nr:MULTISPECIES: TldD/PmbA family protein [Clostridium]AAK78210.1 Predicted Zn-dependent proteases, TLDD ortholog [Clostridium acetobutylicum ATCC 824]ADZ19275.1 Zn-dependent protease [Clostridium acetobutylicum EA 2018]AEI31125.1 Zn-dependent protease TldD [Clostridium acetobutylicum DSM 1731]AWV82018.1 TldD/PmbA family protein [Clostridium acetobutylicum]MBC2396064.1 TldD/PmbA family protein [Clostridium acetobutylicum]
MKVKMSEFLIEKKQIIKRLIQILTKDFKYVSVLGTDSHGKRYIVQKTGVEISDSFWNERGFVVRVYNGTGYSEYSFNELDENNIDALAQNIKNRVNAQIETLDKKFKITKYNVINENKIEDSFLGEVKILPEGCSSQYIIERLNKIKDKALNISNLIIDAKAIFHQVHVSKIFISNNKDLYQSYVWSEGYVNVLSRKGNITRSNYSSSSGLNGPELLDEMDTKVENTVDIAIKLLDAEAVKPGEYDVICSPEVSGIIAHEAFGHGVEMDMFVKNRAKAVEYIDKPVASELVTMRDGARSAKHVSSYLFDDEGVMGTDTVIIQDGILKTGLSDTLSAMRLGTKPTGNGKRFSFERKTYARMTNTFFVEGKDKVEDMFASIKKGYLLDCPYSGMEDPKNWGIQCMLNYGLEIKDGKLTGKIVSPVVLTGYVPDLLKSISMVSDKIELAGSGACGKGYKEFAKVSDGGPYIKAKVRLG